MLAFRATVVTAIILSGALATVAPAQQTPATPPKACQVDEGKPSDVAKTYLALSQVIGKPTDASKTLAGAIKLITSGDKNNNPVGHAYEYGKALVLWTLQPDVSLNPKRGMLGFTDNPDGTIDMPMAIDSAFTVVETAMPECKADAAKWRTQKAWVTLINGAIQDLNAGNYDSANVHAQRSLILSHDSPYATMVLGQVAMHLNHTDEAIKYYQQTVALTGTDSTMAEVKRSTLLNLANMSANAAEDASDPAVKTKYYAAAKDAFQQLASASPAGSQYVEAARSGLVRMDLASGDTASVKKEYEAMLANPSTFTFNQLLQSGVVASQANDNESALKLFQDANDQNPYQRDGLKNLAIMETKAKAPDYYKIIALYQRLMDIDPNGDNLRLGTVAYAGLAQRFQRLNHDIVPRANATKDVKLKKILVDSAALTDDSAKVNANMAVTLSARVDSQMVKVIFSEFSNLNNKVTLAGSIQNFATTEKSFVYHVDFLDKTGQVVASQETPVGPVPPQSSMRFSVTVTAPGIAAFRYTKLQ